MTGANRSHVLPLCSYLSSSTSVYTLDSHSLFAELTPPLDHGFHKEMGCITQKRSPDHSTVPQHISTLSKYFFMN